MFGTQGRRARSEGRVAAATVNSTWHLTEMRTMRVMHNVCADAGRQIASSLRRSPNWAGKQAQARTAE
jgi:hypothetical protein